jgi:Flp pilus assembly protein TadD
MLRGEITGADADTLYDLTVELVPAGVREIPMRAQVERDGSFKIQNLEPGIYELTVRDRTGGEIQSQHLTVSSFSSPIMIRLAENALPKPKSSTHTVSVAHLRHKVPKRASKLYRESVKDLQNGNMEASIQKMQAALSIDPEFMEAYNDLGTRYVTIKEYAKALECFQKAEKLDPAAPKVLSNEAISLLALGRPEQAEGVARRALQLDPSSLSAKQVLALSVKVTALRPSNSPRF